MTKLNKAQLKRQEELSNDLASKFSDLTEAVEKFNEAVEAAWAAVEEAVSEYNSAIEEANAFAGEIHTAMEDYMGERSDKWHESDKASAYGDWVSNWDTDLDPVELEKPDELDTSDIEDYGETYSQRAVELEA